jgi:2-oxoglutarate/2-oxoacid ferredoxin oxidoreductase subunit beta
MGSIDYPINALCIAIASEATFIARTLDTDPRHMASIIGRALQHRGVSFVEIYQNCIVFNDKAFAPVTGREHREDRMIYLEHGKPLTFGTADKKKAFRLKGMDLEEIPFDPKADPSGYLIHDEKRTSPYYAYLLTQMTYPDHPVPFGVFRCIEKPTYIEMMNDQIAQAVAKKGKKTLKDLIYGDETWTVK